MPIEFDLATDNYAGTHNFQIEIEGLDVLNQEVVAVSGVVSETVGDEVHYQPIEIERIYKGTDSFYEWRVSIESSKITKRDMTITMLDSAFRQVRSIEITGAWPSKWELPPMVANAGDATKERITLTVDTAKEVAPR